MSNEVRVDPTPFASTLRHEFTATRLAQIIEKAIADSFKHERERGERVVVSDTEVRRRSEICLKWFRVMRGDMGYSVDRTFDFIPRALRTELDGGSFEPVSAAVRSAWAPESVLPKVGT
jgi:hypothetical protein